jgi:hypothetical protein
MVTPGPATGAVPPVIEPSAPGDFALYRSTLMTDAFTQNQTSSTNEPSLGTNCEVAFYTGNWYACVSSDGGRNFAYVDPTTTFPAYSGGFCCDQVVYYERTRGLMCWYLQYVGDAVGNTVVIAVSSSNANTVNNTWCHYAITPQAFGYADGVEFDFPDLSASSNFLYITTNILGAGDNAIVIRLDLDDLSNCATVTAENFTSSLANLRATHGAAGTMYVGTQVDDNTLRIYSWPEADASPTSVDRDVDTWFTVPSSAPSPDGTNWVQRDFHDILASWVGGGVVGFMWGSAQGGGFPLPNVRFARFDEAGLGLSDQGQIWSNDVAWAYPAVHPNDKGDVGGTIGFGGGGDVVPYPSVAAWIADDFNSDTIQPLESAFVAGGDAGPASNRWGDYFTSRRNEPFDQTWSASGFVLNGGQTGGFVDPYFVWFGREEDTPAPPTITCPSDITVECSAIGGTPAGDPQLAGFFAGVSASDICDSEPEITNDAPALFPVGSTTVTFTAETNLGFTNTCNATVNVEDTTPPDIVCPGDITVECTASGGTPADDPQLIPFFTGVSATDICDASPDITNDAPAFFPLGETVVTFTATDAEGNYWSCTATVTVEDTTPPTIDVTLDRDTLWPPNHRLVTITATVEVTDICDPNPTYVLTSITSDEPDNGTGDGDTANDIQDAAYGTADDVFRLRSERQGGGDGRTYTIIYTASDESGNTAAETVYVNVPHDQSGVALSTSGFTEDGTAFESSAKTFVIAIFTTETVDAETIVPERVEVGNHLGVLAGVEYVVEDLNQDGEADLTIRYEVDPTVAIMNMEDEGQTYPVGIRYETEGAEGYLVGDILALGPPWVPAVTGVGSPLATRALYAVEPNPFTQTTRMLYSIGGSEQRVEIVIYNVAGQRLRTLVSGVRPPGQHEAVWDGRDDGGAAAPAGVYFLQAQIGSEKAVRRVSLVR